MGSLVSGTNEVEQCGLVVGFVVFEGTGGDQVELSFGAVVLGESAWSDGGG